MILAIFSARNEAYHLPFYLAHLAPHVDGFLALDDGSTDRTRAILEAQSNMLDVLANEPRPDDVVLREPENRRRLLFRARELGAKWVLCLDPDERLEERALERLDQLRHRAERERKPLVAFRLRELWDSPMHYRVDGVWGRKERVRFFAMPRSELAYAGSALHGPWYPEEHAGPGKTYGVAANIYHLKMIRERDREERRRLYNRLDPERQWQRVGYDYLTDERGLRLNRIMPWRGYAPSSIPPDLRDLRPRRGARDVVLGEITRGIDALHGVVRVARG
jgi:hypothetical protein